MILNDSITNQQTITNVVNKNKSKNPTCPICRKEIIDCIRFFKS